MYAQPLSPFQSRNLLGLCLTAIVAATLSMSGATTAKHHSCGSSDFVGCAFEGDVIEAGDKGLVDDRVTTLFWRQPDGHLTGQYIVTTKHGVYAGELVQHSPMHDRTVAFDWKDKWGEGLVDVTFDSDYCEFSGSWSTGDGSMNGVPWGGHRN
jgi:hypothetical protein